MGTSAGAGDESIRGGVQAQMPVHVQAGAGQLAAQQELEEEDSQDIDSNFSDSESGGASEAAAECPAQASSSPLRHGAGAGGMAGRHRSRAPHDGAAQSLQESYESPVKRFKGNQSPSPFNSPDVEHYTRNLLPS